MKAQAIYLLVGVPASGKSWVCARVSPKFNYISHDSFIGKSEEYLAAIIEDASNGNRPVLAETPFSMSQLMEPLTDKGFKVTPVFIIEDPRILKDRWEERGTNGHARNGHLTRQETYKTRAAEYSAFTGNSLDVLEHLNFIAANGAHRE